MNASKIAVAFAAFITHLTATFGKPINLSTIQAASKLLTEVMGALEDSD